MWLIKKHLNLAVKSWIKIFVVLELGACIRPDSDQMAVIDCMLMHMKTSPLKIPSLAFIFC